MSNKKFIIIASVVCIVISVFIAHFASSSPDGLEKVAQKLGFEQRAGESVVKSAMPDYTVPQIKNEKISASLAGAIGVGVTFSLAFGVAYIFIKRKK